MHAKSQAPRLQLACPPDALPECRSWLRLGRHAFAACASAVATSVACRRCEDVNEAIGIVVQLLFRADCLSDVKQSRPLFQQRPHQP